MATKVAPNGGSHSRYRLECPSSDLSRLLPASWEASQSRLDQERWSEHRCQALSISCTVEYDNRRPAPMKDRARLAVGAWIEDRYNHRRRHSAVGMISRYGSTGSIGTWQKPLDSVNVRWGDSQVPRIRVCSGGGMADAVARMRLSDADVVPRAVADGR